MILLPDTGHKAFSEADVREQWGLQPELPAPIVRVNPNGINVSIGFEIEHGETELLHRLCRAFDLSGRYNPRGLAQVFDHLRLWLPLLHQPRIVNGYAVGCHRQIVMSALRQIGMSGWYVEDGERSDCDESA